MRKYSLVDRLVSEVDCALRTITSAVSGTRDNPAKNSNESQINAHEKKKSIGLMRVNHTGEVCAQALYRGQAFVASSLKIKKLLLEASQEEEDHLAWCQSRVQELGGHTSYLNPLFYTSSFVLGVIAGVAGDGVSLGFVEETENQVGKHLQGHLGSLPIKDHKSRVIVAQMQKDEAKHAATASAAGAANLPAPIKTTMRYFGKVMTSTCYWL